MILAHFLQLSENSQAWKVYKEKRWIWVRISGDWAVQGEQQLAEGLLQLRDMVDGSMWQQRVEGRQSLKRSSL